MSISSNVERKMAFQPLVGDVKILEWNDPNSVTEIDQTVAAVILETIQGDAVSEFRILIGFRAYEGSAPKWM